jgi:hypothetical protein
VSNRLIVLLLAMKVKLTTTVLLIVCSIGIGWLAFENLMWALWGKQNRWFEYVGFWGCSIMFGSGLIALKSLRLGTFLGCVGFILMVFYLGPALVNTFHEMIVGNLALNPSQVVELSLITGLPALTLLRLISNIKRMTSAART